MGRQTGRIIAAISMAAVMLGLSAAATFASQVSAEALMSKLSWRPVGPYIGGRVVAVAGVPSEPDLFYMGAAGGGVWKSTDYGIKWVNISDGRLPSGSPSIGAIAVASSNPNVLYLGTGECDIRNDMITGDGVYKSADAGKTWHYAGLRDTHTICDIVVDPQNPEVVYAASMGHVFGPNPQRGVFKSTDGGKTWQKILYVNDQTGAIDLVMMPNNPKVLYAVMWQADRTPWGLSSGGAGSGIFKTTDGGAKWTNLTHSQGFPEGVLGRIGIAVTAANPSVVYAIVQAAHGGVFRSNDGGANWARVNRTWALRQRAFYYMSIYADPKNADTVYVPEVDALWVSHDGAKTFRKLHTPHGDNHIVWINPNQPNILLEGNDGGATVSTDGGKTWSDDHNQPTGQFYHVNLDDQFPFHIYGAQQDEGSFEGPSASPGGAIPLADWRQVAYGESTYSVPQPGDPDETYGSGYFSIFIRYNSKTGQFQGISPWPDYQEGASSAELKYRFGWTHPILFAPVTSQTSFPGTAQDHQHQLVIASQVVLKSDDDGLTWKQISPDLTRNAVNTESPSGGPVNLDQSGAEIYPLVSALAVSPLDDNVIWAGSDDGLVHVTTDGGKTWQDARPPQLPEWSWVSAIQPSYAAAGTAYLAARRYMWDDFHPYVFKTTDFGRHWTEITAGLPDDCYVFDIRQDLNDPDLLFLGAKNSVYVSLDAGAHWLLLKLNLPTVQVRDIAVDTGQGDVVLATHGRAFWILDNLALLEQLTKKPGVESDAAYLFEPQTAWLTHAYGTSTGGFKPVNAGKNPPFGATVFFHIPAAYEGKTPANIKFTDSAGNMIRTFDLHLATKQGKIQMEGTLFDPTQLAQQREEKLTGIKPGMNSFQWDLRYPRATEVKGFQPPIAAGGMEDTVDGPEVTPGTYWVVLDYGGKTMRRRLTVSLDLRLHPSPGALDARMAFELKIHDALDRLNTTINRAIAERDKLQASVVSHRLSQAQAQPALASLDHEIGELVQLNITSSEASLVFETKLRSHLAFLAADVGLAYSKPTAAEYAVFEYLSKKASAGEEHLNAAIAQAEKLP
jgi:photosystem II stability/assembly factor-like uncharacterized protein